MSILKCSTIEPRDGINLRLASSSSINLPGHVLQVKTVRTEVLTTYSLLTTGDGIIISQLDLSITPKSPTSLLLCKWMLMGEVNQETVALIHRDSSLITTAGYEGKSTVGSDRWVGVAAWPYDGDDSSTPSHLYIQHIVPSGSTSPTTLSLALRRSTTSAATFYLNRAIGGASANYEVGVSCGVVYEIGA